MAYINRGYTEDGYKEMYYSGGNCGCSDCLTDGGNKMLPNPMYDEAHIMPYPYPNTPMCKCPACIEGGNIFDELANAMPSIVGNVPIFGALLKPAAQFTLDVLDPYRKNPRNPKQPTEEPYKQPAYQPTNTNFSASQRNILNRLKGNGKVKKGSADAKARMAYLRSLRKR
jgi:hypothetical protein